MRKNKEDITPHTTGSMPLPPIEGSKPMGKAIPSQLARQWMPVVISCLVLLSALYIILSANTYADAQQKWAFGAVGTILGYWFKR